jgi:hypothetical protein
MPRGGYRHGAPGKNYAQRTDMALGPRKLPVTTAPSDSYGQATELTQSQQAVPMASGPLPAAPTDVTAQAQAYTPPPVVPMGQPSMNPTEHVTAGMGQPPPAAPSPVLKAVALLNTLGEDASPATKAIRDVLAATQANQATP